MTGTTILETPRLYLREYTEDGMAAVCEPILTRVEEARAILRVHPLADYRKYGYGRWACVLRGTGAHIGFAGLSNLEDLKEVDVGYRLLSADWGAGLGTEASAGCVRYGFGVLRLARIIGLVDPANRASVRVLEKSGLVFEELITFRSGRPPRRHPHHPLGAALRIHLTTRRGAGIRKS